MDTVLLLGPAPLPERGSLVVGLEEGPLGEGLGSSVVLQAQSERPGFKSWICHLPAEGRWPRHITLPAEHHG